MAVYLKYEHDFPSTPPREIEYLGPFEDGQAAVDHVNRWGGMHGLYMYGVEEPPTDGVIYSPEEHIAYQKGRE